MSPPASVYEPEAVALKVIPPQVTLLHIVLPIVTVPAVPLIPPKTATAVYVFGQTTSALPVHQLLPVVLQVPAPS